MEEEGEEVTDRRAGTASAKEVRKTRLPAARGEASDTPPPPLHFRTHTLALAFSDHQSSHMDHLGVDSLDQVMNASVSPFTSSEPAHPLVRT